MKVEKQISITKSKQYNGKIYQIQNLSNIKIYFRKLQFQTVWKVKPTAFFFKDRKLI